MRLPALSLAVLLTGFLFACGGDKPEGDSCSFDPSDASDDCAAGLFCQTASHCNEVCTGRCVKSCSADADCGTGRLCSGITTPESGQKKFCR